MESNGGTVDGIVSDGETMLETWEIDMVVLSGTVAGVRVIPWDKEFRGAPIGWAPATRLIFP